MKNNNPSKINAAIIAVFKQHAQPFTVFYLPFKIYAVAFFAWILAYGCVPASYYAQAYINYAATADKNGKLDSAAYYYGLAISKDAGNAKAYNNRAMVYAKMGKYKDAAADVEKAISINKRYWDAYYTRGYIYEKQELFNQAITEYSTYISKGDKKVTDYYLGYWGRGKCNQYVTKMEDAIHDFTEALKIKPADFYLYSWRGQCYVEMNKYVEASKDLETFLAQYPSSYKERFKIGICYVKMAEKDKAEKVFLKLAEIDPSFKVYFPGEKFLDFFNVELRRKIAGNALEEASAFLNEITPATSKTLTDIKYADAFEKLETAWGFVVSYSKEDQVQIDSIRSKLYFVYPKLKDKPAIPEYVRRFAVQASSFVEEKNYNAAIELYQRAIMIVPYYPLAHFNIAMLYATTYNYKTAIEQMNSYLKLTPDAKDARAAQDKIYEWEVKVKN